MKNLVKKFIRLIYLKLQRLVVLIERYLNNSKKYGSYHFKFLVRISYCLTLFDLIAYKKRITFSQFMYIFLINISPKIPSILTNQQRVKFLHAALASTTNLEHIKFFKINEDTINDFILSKFTEEPVTILDYEWLRLIRILEFFNLWGEHYHTLESMLKSLTIKDSQQGWRITYALFQELAVFGNYEIGEMLLLVIKNMIMESSGSRTWSDDGVYFSAVGHQAQFGWLVESHLLLNNLPGANFKTGKYTLGNGLLGEKWINKTKSLGWKFNEFNNQNDLLAQDDLECFPVATGAKLLRREVGTIHSRLLHQSVEPLIRLTDEECSKSISLLEDYGLPKNRNFKIIGLHVRSGIDSFGVGRNSSILKYKSAVEKIAEHGDWTIAIGDEEQGRKFGKMKLPNFINLAVKQNKDRDLLHLYVWAKSFFFIGNLSGGTFPPTIFRTPILWIDLYPLRHFRPPSINDLIIPKVVLQHNFSIGPVSYQKVLSSTEHFYNSENPFILRSRGLSLQEADSEDIINGIEEMYVKSTLALTLKASLSHNKLDKLYNNLNLPIGASWSPTFVKKWEHLIA
jgi:putative glycosyltransferase (TIGR04372 family)